MTLVVRSEQPGDAADVAAVTTAAFAGKPYSDGSEALIVERLRADGDLALSLVADDDGVVVGHVAFSPVAVSDGSEGWLGLGPVSVAPDRQKQGIGASLIESGLAELKTMRAKGCVVLGDPVYYRRFGFAHDPQLRYPGPPPEYFQVLSFGGSAARGEVSYAPAFG